MTVRAVVLLITLLLAACTSRQTACSTIGWSNGLTVRLADDWPAGLADSVALSCPPDDTCPGSAEWPEGPLSLTDGTAQPGFGFATPDTVVVTVLDAAGEPLARHEVSPEWRHVGDDGGCPGPEEADPVVVPAP